MEINNSKINHSGISATKSLYPYIHNLRTVRFEIVTWPKKFVFGQVLFSSACMCLSVCLSVCVSVCVSVSLYIDYLKKLLTDFDETWQEDV